MSEKPLLTFKAKGSADAIKRASSIAVFLTEARDFHQRGEDPIYGFDLTQTTAREAAMNKIDRYAANLAPPSLILPEYQRFRIDGQGIGERSMAMAAKLPRPEPAAIIAISRVSASMPQVAKLDQTTKTI
jgi:hypothetical protein